MRNIRCSRNALQLLPGVAWIVLSEDCFLNAKLIIVGFSPNGPLICLCLCIKLLALSGEGAAGPNQLTSQAAREELQHGLLLHSRKEMRCVLRMSYL